MTSILHLLSEETLRRLLGINEDNLEAYLENPSVALRIARNKTGLIAEVTSPTCLDLKLVIDKTLGEKLRRLVTGRELRISFFANNTTTIDNIEDANSPMVAAVIRSFGITLVGLAKELKILLSQSLPNKDEVKTAIRSAIALNDKQTGFDFVRVIYFVDVDKESFGVADIQYKRKQTKPNDPPVRQPREIFLYFGTRYHSLIILGAAIIEMVAKNMLSEMNLVSNARKDFESAPV